MHYRTALLTTLAVASLATIPDAQTWTVTFDGDNNAGAALGIGPDGITVVHRRGGQAAQVAIDPHGNVERAYQHQQVNGSLRWRNVLAETDGTNVYVGNTDDGKPWMIAAKGPFGQKQWSSGASAVDTELADVCRTSDGRYVAVGTRENAAGVEQPYLWSTGGPFSAAWRKQHGNGSTDEQGLAVAPLANGGVAFASRTQSELRLTYVSFNGGVMFQKQMIAAETLSQPHLAPTSDGGVVLAGLCDGQFFAMRFDGQGKPLFARRYLSYAGDAFFGSAPGVAGVTATPDGGFAIAVTQPAEDGSYQDDPAVLRIESNGYIRYLRSFGTGLDESAEDIAVTPDGGIVLAGSVFNGSQIRVARLDEAGLPAAGCGYVNHTVQVIPYGMLITSSSPVALDDPTPWGTATATPSSVSVAHQVACIDDCMVAAGSLGSGLAGSGGIEPKLLTADGACLGWTPDFRIEDAIGGAPGVLGLSLSLAPVQLFGGWIYPNISQVVMVPITLGGAPGVAGAGSLTVDLVPDKDLTWLQGQTLFAQAVLFDQGAPEWVSMTAGASWTVQ